MSDVVGGAPAQYLVGDVPGLVPGNTYAPLGVHGCYLVYSKPDASDERGELLRPYKAVDLTGDADVDGAVDDIVVRSYSNVFRGMHVQTSDAPQWKYVRVTRGIAVGAVLDTRKNRHGDLAAEVTLTDFAPRTGLRRDVGILVPPWCAWGYWSSFGACEVTYRIWGKRVVEAERSIHYASVPIIDARWFDRHTVIMSERDRNAKPLEETITGW